MRGTKGAMVSAAWEEEKKKRKGAGKEDRRKERTMKGKRKKLQGNCSVTMKKESSLHNCPKLEKGGKNRRFRKFTIGVMSIYL